MKIIKNLIKLLIVSAAICCMMVGFVACGDRSFHAGACVGRKGKPYAVSAFKRNPDLFPYRRGQQTVCGDLLHRLGGGRHLCVCIYVA